MISLRHPPHSCGPPKIPAAPDVLAAGAQPKPTSRRHYQGAGRFPSPYGGEPPSPLAEQAARLLGTFWQPVRHLGSFLFAGGIS